MKVISGGQTGVDRAAIDAAIEQGIDYGGYIPKNRKAEDGRISDKYSKLIEIKETDYRVRTEKNVKQSNATLIIYFNQLYGGTLLTKEFAEKYKQDYLCIDLLKETPNPIKKIRKWLEIVEPKILNIAGPRESTNPGIYETTKGLLTEVFKRN